MTKKIWAPGRADGTGEVIYPEMLEYAWVEDLDRVTENSKHVRGVRRLSDMPKIPISHMLAIMRETASRSEVMAAYSSAPVDGQIPQKERHLLSWYQEYLGHKYGTWPDTVSRMTGPMRALANGVYSGLDDPKLVSDLLKDPFICEDNCNDHDSCGSNCR